MRLSAKNGLPRRGRFFSEPIFSYSFTSLNIPTYDMVILRLFHSHSLESSPTTLHGVVTMRNPMHHGLSLQEWLNRSPIMSNFTDSHPTIDENQSAEDDVSNFSRRTLEQCMCPRRYIIALLLSVLLVIDQEWVWAIIYSALYPLTDESKEMIEYPFSEFPEVFTIYASWKIKIIVYALINILGGVLIYLFSSHKFLLVTVTASSLLYVLKLSAMKLHSTAFLLVVMIGQNVFLAPIFVAVLSMWKDWSPPEERTRLVTISFLGIVVEVVSALIIIDVDQKLFESTIYIVGFAGLIWAVFWYNITSSSPQNDPLITEKEYLYLESKIPSYYQEKARLKDVPWKKIFTSSPVIALYFCFYKLGGTVQAIKSNGMFYIILTSFTDNNLIVVIPFIASFIFVIIGSSFLMDFLLKKYKAKALTVRKIFMCSGFVLYSAFLLGSLAVGDSWVLSALFAIAYCSFAFSIPGILTSPLNLSPPYVSIISGVAFGCYYIGQLMFLCSTSRFDPQNLASKLRLILFESVTSLFIVSIYGLNGDSEEQPWSSLRSSQRRTNSDSEDTALDNDTPT